MLWKWFLWVVTLSATSQSYKIRVIYDDFFAQSVQSNWKSSLELVFRQLAIRNGAKVQIENFHPKMDLQFRNGTHRKTLLLTNCGNSRLLSRREDRGGVLILDAMPCKQETFNAIPLSWSQENWFCFYARFNQWINSEIITGSAFSNIPTKRDQPKICHFDWRKTRYTTVNKVMDSAKLHLRGKNIPVGILHIPPSSFVKTDANYSVSSFTGQSRNLTDLLYHILQVKYTPIVSLDRNLGVYLNGSWNGLIGLMLKGALRSVDFQVTSQLVQDIGFASAPFYMTYDRYQAVYYPAIIYDNVNTIVIRAPQEETKLWAAVAIYDKQVWGYLVLSMNCMAASMWILLRSLEIRSNDLVHHLLYVLRILVGQGEELQSKRYAVRVLAAIWCLAAVVFVNVYTSMLMSSLIVPELRPSADSLEDVVYKSDLEPVAKSGTSWESLIMNSNTEAMKTLAQKVRKNPRNFWVDSNEQGIKRVLGGKHAYLSTQGILQYEVAADFEAYKRCRLYITKHSFNRAYIAGILPKDGPSNEAYNYAIGLLNAHGWTQYWDPIRATDRKRGTMACLKSRNQTPASKELTLQDLISGFLVLAIGITTALTILLCEKFDSLKLLTTKP